MPSLIGLNSDQHCFVSELKHAYFASDFNFTCKLRCIIFLIAVNMVGNSFGKVVLLEFGAVELFMFAGS